MYKIIKDEGRSSNVFLQNFDTKDTLNLGHMTLKMLDLLKISGYVFDDTETIISAWDYAIIDSTVDEFKRIAMPMRKPIRKTKVNNDVTETTKEKDDEEEDDLDLFDLIYND